MYLINKRNLYQYRAGNDLSEEVVEGCIDNTKASKAGFF